VEEDQAYDEPAGVPSWEEIVDQHSDRVYRLAFRLTGNRHDAEDLTQEVFVRVFRSLSTYQPGTFEGWIHRITTNLFLDQARRKQRIRFEGLGDDAAERLRGREPSPAQAYDDQHLDGDIQTALDALAPEYRAAVVLCDLQGQTQRAAARALGWPDGTLTTRLIAARRLLARRLTRRGITLSAGALTVLLSQTAAPARPAPTTIAFRSPGTW